MFFYYLKKFLTTDTIVLAYLGLSPFFAATTYPSVNIIKYVVASITSVLVIALYLKSKLIDFNTEISWNRYFTVALLFFAWLFISTLLPGNQFDPFPFEATDTSIRRARDVLSIVIVSFCCYQLINFSTFLRLIRVFYYTYFISVIGVFWNLIFDKYSLDGNVQKVRRLCSFMHDPNIFGLYLVFIIVLAYLFFLRESDRLARIKHILICISAVAILFFTFSRSAMLTLVMLICVLFFKINLRINRRILAVCFVFVLILGAFQFQQRMQYYNISKSKVDFSDFGRLSVGYAALNIIKEHWGIGIGFENARFLVRSFDSPKYPVDWNMVSVHNTYLAVAAELGIIGLALFLLNYFMIFKDTRRAMNRRFFPENLLFIFFFCVVLSYLLHGLVYHIYFNSHTFYLMMLLNLLALKHKDELRQELQVFRL